MRGGTLTESYSTGCVRALRGTAGGLVGIASAAVIENCYSTAAVSAPERAGGIAGLASEDTSVRCCYGSGNAKTETWRHMGHVIGEAADTRVEYSYAVNGADALAPSVNGEEASGSAAYAGFNFDNT